MAGWRKPGPGVFDLVPSPGGVHWPIERVVNKPGIPGVPTPGVDDIPSGKTDAPTPRTDALPSRTGRIDRLG